MRLPAAAQRRCGLDPRRPHRAQAHAAGGWSWTSARGRCGAARAGASCAASAPSSARPRRPRRAAASRSPRSCASRTPSGFLGPWALHLTAHSDVLDDYGGGPGTVAIHGRARGEPARPARLRALARLHPDRQPPGPLPRARARPGRAGDRAAMTRSALKTDHRRVVRCRRPSRGNGGRSSRERGSRRQLHLRSKRGPSV